MISLLLGLALGSRISALPQASMDASLAGQNRYKGTVITWYGTHFEGTPIHDWVPIKEWNGPFHPLLGDYRTDDRKVMRTQLEWMRRAGIDVILYDVCRIDPKQTLFDLGQQRTLRLLVDELSHQDRESRKLKLAMWVEKWDANPTAAQYRFGLDYIKKNLAKKDFYYRLNGKPLVLRYLNDPAPDFSSIDADFANDFTLRKISPSTQPSAWGYFYSEANSPECMTVNPGADGYMENAFINGKLNHQSLDVAALRAHGKDVVANRDNGRLFEKEFLHVRQADPKLIFISGWNDWAYCMQIEPAVEYRYQYVDMAARLLGREAETAPYRRGK